MDGSLESFIDCLLSAPCICGLIQKFLRTSTYILKHHCRINDILGSLMANFLLQKLR
jgi:hypothetical protein